MDQFGSLVDLGGGNNIATALICLSTGQEHDVVAPSQPSSSTPPVPSISSPQVLSTPTSIPATIPSPTPIPKTEPEPFEYTFEEPSSYHQPFSPPQNRPKGVGGLETDLKQTKLTMGNAIVKKSQDDPLDSSVQGLVTPSTTKVKALGEEQVEDISPNTLEAAKTLSKVASLKPRSIDKGRRYKRRKEAKGKKVVSSLYFQEGVDTGAEQVNTAEGVNTGSIKLSTGNEQVSTVGVQKSTSSEDKGQREGKAPMLSEETPKKSKEQILQEEASLAEAIRLDSLLSTGSEQVSTVSAKKSTSSVDKGQREGKAPMISEETPKKSKEQILQEEASLVEAIRLDSL
ncbi:hypothetical protein Tco_1434850 [Tanacetum coccineum]